MATPIKDFVRQVLAENSRDINLLTAIRYGWDRRTAYPNHARWRRRTTRAHAVWEETIDKFIELLADDDGVHVERHYDTVSFIFDDAVLLRLKKADTMLRSRNVQTALSDLFDDHDVDALPGFAGLQRVEAVYVLNRFETRIDWAGVVATDQHEVPVEFRVDGCPLQTMSSSFRCGQDEHSFACQAARTEYGHRRGRKTMGEGTVMPQQFNHYLLLLARQFREGSQSEVAAAAALNQGTIPGLKTALLPEGPSEENVRRIACGCFVVPV